MSIAPGRWALTLRRSVALRTGVVAAVSTSIALLLLTLIVYLFLVSRLETRVEDSLTARHSVGVSNLVRFSDEERELFRRFRKALPVRDEGVFAWLDGDGNFQTGSVSGVDCREGFYDGWLDISQSAEDNPLPLMLEKPAKNDNIDRFRFLARPRGENCLVFGKDLYEVDSVRQSVMGLFIWLLPLCLLPSLLISFLYSMSLRKRLLGLGNVVRRVADGELDARVTVVGDDDIDLLAKTTNRSFDRLQESVTTLQQLTSVIAHDLRAPLNRATIPLDEAIRASEAGKDALDALYDVREGLNDARSVFDALLRITQIESGRRRDHFQPIDLFSLSEELFEIYEAVVEETGRVLEFQVRGEGTSMIEGDADLLRQALVNMVENAIRYTPDGAQIRIGVQRRPKSPVLFVSDNGDGLPAQEREKVTRRLYRYQGSTRGQSGHGLGLSLVKAIAVLHNGQLRLDDAKPGLKVSMYLNDPEVLDY